jgi:hypothetical protein
MKRYAIKFPDGTYSDGPRMRRVAFEKAKLWTNRGHVLTHLQGIYSTRTRSGYPDGTQVVEVEFVHTEQPVMLVADYLNEHEQKKAKERAASHERFLLSQKEHLERELQAIKAKLGK